MANPEGYPSTLTPWKKGQTGNPSGYSLKRRLMDLLEKCTPEEIRAKLDGTLKAGDALACQMVLAAHSGWLGETWSESLLRDIFDRVDGKPKSTDEGNGFAKLSDFVAEAQQRALAYKAAKKTETETEPEPEPPREPEPPADWLAWHDLHGGPKPPRERE